MEFPILYQDSNGLPENIQITSDEPRFRIFTSYRRDPERSFQTPGTDREALQESAHYLLPYHRDRLMSSAIALGWSNAAAALAGEQGLDRLLEAVESHVSSMIGGKEDCDTRKIRITVSKTGDFEVDSLTIENIPLLDPREKELLPTTLSFLSSGPNFPRLCTVVLDREPTQPSIFTTHKTTARNQYNRARDRVNVSHVSPNVGEVLIFNPADEVMEGSLSTPYFLRNGHWVTPALSSGGNSGTTRRFALTTGLCVEEIVKVESLQDGEAVWISNAVRGFVSGTLQLD